MRTAALLLEQDLSFHLGERELPAPAPGEVTVAVDWAGVCGSDLHALGTGAWIEYWPATIGHEVVGTVVDGDSPELPPGTRVVVDSRIPCRRCTACERSPRLCENLTWLGESRPGGYAGHLHAPLASLTPVPDATSTDEAVLAEPLAVTLCALDQVAQPPRHAVVLGHGPIGALCAVEVARRWPDAALTVVEPGATRAGYARTAGLTVVDNLAAAPSGVDLVVDAAGYATSVRDGLGALGRGGTLLLIALGHGEATVSPSDVVEHGWSIIGSIGFEDHHLPEALALLGSGTADYAAVVTHRLPLAEVPGFLARGGQHEALKVVMGALA